MIKNIRPNQVMQLVNPSEEPCWFQIPSRGGLITLESIILVSLMKIFKVRKVFEFGTYLGFTTRLFVENLNNSTESLVVTLDLDQGSLSGIDFHPSDKILALESTNNIKKEYAFSSNAKKVSQIYMNSLDFNSKKYSNFFDMVFVDANHELNYAKHDTENAFNMIKDKACIVWHDYGNPDFPDLTKYLNDLAHEKSIFHVEETMMCFYAKNLDIPSSKGKKPKN